MNGRVAIGAQAKPTMQPRKPNNTLQNVPTLRDGLLLKKQHAVETYGHLVIVIPWLACLMR